MKKLSNLFVLLCICSSLIAWNKPIPKLNIGMNINSTNYYTAGLIFTDVMTTCAFRLDWSSGDYVSNVPQDNDGYPLEIPYANQGTKTVRFLISNFYVGKYVVLFDGAGTMTSSVSSTTENGRLNINLTGTGGNIWIDIKTSTRGNHIRNIRIVPKAYENDPDFPVFLPEFLDGLRPFHALRFMDWTGTNNSTQKEWSKRPTPTSINKRNCLEYAILLCNTLNQDGWFCVPHLADDNYIREHARFVRDNLNPNLKSYVEYSNEIWNWTFAQSQWILNNATGSTDQYVIDGLKAINPAAADHPEKDAFMISRVFRIWGEEFTGLNSNRLIKVAGVQHGWPDNTRRILEYLKNKGIQCDMVSPGGYFNFTKSDHTTWNAMNPASVTADMICDVIPARMAENEAKWTDANALFAKQYNVAYGVYEGGQHMQPYLQGDYAYNHAVWDAQINPKMYDLYMANFEKHIEPAVNCQIFMAFSYVGERASKYGSWGHLENYGQLKQDLMVVAPKYKALLDANIDKNNTTGSSFGIKQGILTVFPNPAQNRLNLKFNKPADNANVIVTDLQGRQLLTKTIEGEAQDVDIQELNKGVYFLKLKVGNENAVVKFIKE